MDQTLMLLLIAAFVLLLLVALLLVKRSTAARSDAPVEPVAARGELNRDQRRPRQAVNVVGGQRRNVRNRVRRVSDQSDEDVPAAPAAADSDENDDAAGQDDDTLVEGKFGKKKLAKLQAKKEKQEQREAELEDRERKKRLDAEKEKERKRKDELEEQAELAQALEEKRRREEQERRDHEEYLRMKAAFSVEQEGFDEEESRESDNMLIEFIDFIHNRKVVSMDELAQKFALRAQDAVDRVKRLVADRQLTGVFDDRGKFLYLRPSELQAVAKFINQRGRVSVAEIAEYSNSLIALEPADTAVTVA